MNIFKLLGGIKKKFVEPKVYALELEFGNQRKLYIGAAYSLEEAKETAHKEWLPLKEVRMTMWTYVKISDLLSEYTSAEVNVDTPEVTSHNTLMDEILKKKDLSLLEQKRALLTDSEYRFLLDKITTP